MNRARLLTASALGMSLVVAVSCSPAPPAPPPPPPPAPVPTPPPPPPPPEPVRGWQDMAIAPGTWVYREDDRGSVALFGPANSPATFVVRCNMADRQIYFSRSGQLSGTGTMSFQASAGTRSYSAQNVSGPQPYIGAATTARDDYLDTLSFSRGRFAVSVTGQPILAIPNWPQMIRVFEDCRS